MHPGAGIKAVCEVRLLPTQEVLHSCIHSKLSTNFNMDRMDKNFADGGTFHEVYLTSSADIWEVPAEDRRVEDEASPPSKLPRTRKFARLDLLYFTSSGDEKVPDLTPSRSSSSSGGEVVFHGRANHKRAISVERVSVALSGLSVSEKEEKNEVGRHDTKVSNFIR